MNTRTLWIVAIVAGLVTAVGIELYLSTVVQDLEVDQGITEVLVVEVDLEPGDAIKAKPQRLAAKYLPRGVVAASDARLLDGKVALRRLRQGMPLTYQDFLAADRRDLVHKIDKGKFAMTIAVNRVTSIANMVQPGDKVDVLIAQAPSALEAALPANGTEIKVHRIPDLKVLAVGAELDPLVQARLDYDTVTVEVDGDQAQRLHAATAGATTAAAVTLLLHSARK